METQADSLRDLRDAAKKAGNDAEAAAVTGAQESARARLAQLRAGAASGGVCAPSGRRASGAGGYGDTAPRRGRARKRFAERRINADVEGWRTKKDDPSKLPAQSMTGESGSPIRAEGAASPVSSTMAEEGAGVNPHARARQRGQLFPIKKPRVASSVSRVFRNEDTSRGIDISHPAGDNGASHKTGFSLSDAVVPVNDTALSGQTEKAPTSSLARLCEGKEGKKENSTSLFSGFVLARPSETRQKPLSTG